MTPMKRGLLLWHANLASYITMSPKDDPDEKGIVTLRPLSFATCVKASQR